MRAFAFIDTTDEVTRFFAGPTSADLAEAMARLAREADLVAYDGHSDYGHAFGVFESDTPTRSPPARRC